MSCVSPQVPDRVPPGTLVTTLQAKDPDEGENGTILYTLTGKGVERRELMGVAHPHDLPHSGTQALTLLLPVPRSWLRALLSAPSLRGAAHCSTPDPGRTAPLCADAECSRPRQPSSELQPPVAGAGMAAPQICPLGHCCGPSPIAPPPVGPFPLFLGYSEHHPCYPPGQSRPPFTWVPDFFLLPRSITGAALNSLG